MRLIEDTYFGWNDVTHALDCERPSWDIDVRHDTGRHFTSQAGTEQHTCPNEDCAHADVFDRVTVRIICRSCHTAHMISGEGLGTTCTTTEALGYGQPPRKTAGIYLWPSAPVLYGYGPGRSGHDDQPHAWLATAEPAERLKTEHCIGAIGRHRTARGALRWWAGALPAMPPVPGHGRLVWDRKVSGFTSVSAAARWIAAAVDPAQQQPLVVNA